MPDIERAKLLARNHLFYECQIRLPGVTVRLDPNNLYFGRVFYPPIPSIVAAVKLDSPPKSCKQPTLINYRRVVIDIAVEEGCNNWSGSQLT